MYCAEMASLQSKEGEGVLVWACGCGFAREHFGLLGAEDLKVLDQFVTPGQWIRGHMA